MRTDPASGTRIERDSMGEVRVPAGALYGAQTQRAIDNFRISGRPMPIRFVRALLIVKQAAAQANVDLGLVDRPIGAAIVDACDRLLADPDLATHFPIDVFQTGSGTSTNMNANEVIATLASRLLGRPVSANDDVNHGQSSNDVIPTTLHVSVTLALSEDLLPALAHLAGTIERKAASLTDFCKTGRTHLMDAMPVRMDQTVGAWAFQVRDAAARIDDAMPALARLAQGGTAVGTGVNTDPAFPAAFCRFLGGRCGRHFEPSPNFFASLASQDAAVAISGQLRGAAGVLAKISNDLRWMNSGPLAGLGEIALPALQPGSSIMPGKVNPVVPEAVAMVAAQVAGNDAAVAIAGQSGNFELNVMLPLIADNLLASVALLAAASRALADQAIEGFTVNEDRLRDALFRNPVLVTALNPLIGYLKAADIAKQAYREGRPIVDVAAEQTDIPRAELERLLDPRRLTGAD
jgi:fumarate hydratase class II